jgi:hypothetical protein
MRRPSPIFSTRNNRSSVIERPCHPCRVAGFFLRNEPQRRAELRLTPATFILAA